MSAMNSGVLKSDKVIHNKWKLLTLIRTIYIKYKIIKHTNIIAGVRTVSEDEN
jgi:hypothetical protein